jgi:hypothetical protein
LKSETIEKAAEKEKELIKKIHAPKSQVQRETQEADDEQRKLRERISDKTKALRAEMVQLRSLIQSKLFKQTNV